MRLENKFFGWEEPAKYCIKPQGLYVGLLNTDIVRKGASDRHPACASVDEAPSLRPGNCCFSGNKVIIPI